jgi:hypothetical protein
MGECLNVLLHYEGEIKYISLGKYPSWITSICQDSGHRGIHPSFSEHYITEDNNYYSWNWLTGADLKRLYPEIIEELVKECMLDLVVNDSDIFNFFCDS